MLRVSFGVHLLDEDPRQALLLPLELLATGPGSVRCLGRLSVTLPTLVRTELRPVLCSSRGLAGSLCLAALRLLSVFAPALRVLAGVRGYAARPTDLVNRGLQAKL